VFLKALITVCIAAGLLICGCGGPVRLKGHPMRPVGLEVHRGINVVYQIKSDSKKDGIGAGLYYVNKLVDAYKALGVGQSDRDIHAVFHGDAGYWMLNDDAYARVSPEDVNPNKQTIRKLQRDGVHLEICASTMKNNGWKPSDVLEGVVIVVGAYPRIIDLQQQDYAYIRF
jgi:intracellular sulfur oxidation DsrE/DsrF family protein